MSGKLELIKALRAKGATIRMIDDVAAHLESNGGYDSPVFIATVEFIIKIRQMLQSIMIQQEQSVSIASEFTEKDIENVNFNAAREGVKNDGEIEDYEREKILNHIYEIEAQHENFLENNSYKLNQNIELQARDSKSKKGRDNKKGGGILEKLFRISMLNSQKNNQQKKQQQQQETQQQVTQNTRQNAGQQVQQVVQAVQRSSVTRMNIVRMKLMSALKVGKDRTVVGDAAWKAKNETKNPQVENKVQKKESNNLSKEKRTVNEISISKVIDEAVKAAKPQKTPAEQQKPAEEKGKFEKKAGEKAGPKADDKKVAEMAVKDAINNLRNSGVKTSAPDAKTKKEIDQQMTQMQASGGATPKLQR